MSLAVATVRGRPGGAAGSFVAVLLAVVLITAYLTVLASSNSGLSRAGRLDGTALVVRADDEARFMIPAVGRRSAAEVRVALPERPRIDAGLADRIRRVPGVQAAIADVSFPAQIVLADGTSVGGPRGTPPSGHGWASTALTPFRIEAGRAPAGDGEVAIDADLADRAGLEVGDRTRVATLTGRADGYTVVGIVAPPGGRGLRAEAALFFDDDTAARLSGNRNRVDQIAVLAPQSALRQRLTEAIRTELGNTRDLVIEPAARAQAQGLGRDATDLFGFLTGFAALVAILVVASTFALSLFQRQREIGMLRAVGATPRQVRRLIAGEAFVISLAAAIAGGPVGVILGMWLGRVFVTTGVVPPGFSVRPGVLPPLAASLIGIAVTQLAVVGAARRAARIPPIAALREASVAPAPLTRRRLVMGGIVLAAGIATLFVSLDTPGEGGAGLAFMSVFVLVVAATLLAPLLAGPASALLGRPLERLAGTSGWLAQAATRTAPRRAAALATPVMLAATLALTVLFVTATVDRIDRRATTAQLVADFVLVSGAGELPASVAQDATGVPGVAAATGTLPTRLVARQERRLVHLEALAVDARAAPAVFALDLHAGSLADLADDGMAVTTDVAAAQGWQVGETAEVWLADGTPARVRVAAVYRALQFGQYQTMNVRQILLPRELVESHTTRQGTDAVYVAATPDADPARVASGLQELTTDYPTLEVRRREAFLDRAWAERSNADIWALVGLMIAYAMVSAVNSVSMATRQRSGEFALLRLAGATPRQVRDSLLAEAMIVVTLAVALSTAVTAVSVAAISRALQGSVGIGVPVVSYLVVVAACAGIALTSSLAAARVALRAQPVHAAAAG